MVIFNCGKYIYWRDVNLKYFKTKNLFFVFLLACFFVFFTEYSAEASIQEAVDIDLNDSTDGILSDYGEEDFYMLSLPSAGNLKISMKEKPDITWQFNLLDSTGKEIDYAYTESSELAKGYTEITTGLPKGDYYIRVKSGSNANKQLYELKTNFESSEYFEKEFNDTLSIANHISVNQNYKGNIGTYSDVDFYKFQLSQDGNVSLSIKRKAGVSWYTEIYDSTGKVLDYMYTDGRDLVTGNETIQIGIPKGEYYVKIKNSSDTLDQPYEFKIGYVNSKYYEKEINDSITLANKISLNKLYKGTLSNTSSEDFFKINVPKSGNVTLSIKQKEGVIWYGHIQDVKGEVFSYIYTDSSQLVKGNAKISVGLPKGTYFIKLSNAYSALGKPYEFKVEYKKSDYFEKEFNNSLSSANSIRLNKNYYGTIQGYDDKDVYKIVVPRTGNVTLSVKNQAGSTWYAHIQNSKGSVYKYFYTNSNELVKGSTSTQVRLKKGTYYINIQNSSGTNNKLYTFSAKFK